MRTTPEFYGGRARRHVSAFTRVELLVVLSVAALLLALRLPALARINSRAVQAQCACNQRQIALALQAYASEYNDLLPTCGSGGSRLWELPDRVYQAICPFGIGPHQLYDPAFPDLDEYGLAVSRAGSVWNQSLYHVIGYALALSNSPGLTPTNANPSIVPQSINYQRFTLPPPAPAQRVLLACATLSDDKNETNRLADNFTQIYVHYSGYQIVRAPHLNGPLPSGGNLAMLDGHVEWRDFAGMHVRTTYSPFFWW